MRILLVLLTLSFTASTASASSLIASIVLRETGLTTNALIYDGAFDVWEIHIENRNNQGATAVELSLPGSFIQAGGTTFHAGTALPVVFGFDAPDTYFVLPVGANPADVLGVGTFDDETGLGSSFVIAGGVEIIPPGNSVVAVISVPAGSSLDTSLFNGRAAVNGQFENIGGDTCLFLDCPCDFHPSSPDCPEPSTALLALLALLGSVGLAVRSRS